MLRIQRALVLLGVSAAALAAACKKKPETAPAPSSGGSNAPAETCGPACRDSIARANRMRDSLEKARRDAEAAKAARENALRATRAALDAKVYFEYDAAELSTEARAILDAKLPVFRANPQLKMRVSGHADERGSDEYNLALGQKRAAAVKRYLTDNGVDAGRIDIVSYGEERPAVEGTEEGSYRQNRRAEFEIITGGDSLVAPK